MLYSVGWWISQRCRKGGDELYSTFSSLVYSLIFDTKLGRFFLTEWVFTSIRGKYHLNPLFLLFCENSAFVLLKRDVKLHANQADEQVDTEEVADHNEGNYHSDHKQTIVSDRSWVLLCPVDYLEQQIRPPFQRRKHKQWSQRSVDIFKVEVERFPTSSLQPTIRVIYVVSWVRDIAYFN